MWFFIFVVLLTLLNHLAESRIRKKVLGVVSQNSAFGQVETWVNSLRNRYKYEIFAMRHDFYAELVFTEKAIIIFGMFKLGSIKLRRGLMVLATSFEDMPQIDSFWYRLQTGMLYRIDSIVIDGRRVLLECTYTMPPGYWCNRTIQYKFLIPDLRDNDAYKNVLLLHRHFHETRNQFPLTF